MHSLFSLPAGPVLDLMGNEHVFVGGVRGRIGKHLSYVRICWAKFSVVFNSVVIQNECKTLPKQKYRIYLLILPSCERQGMIMNLEIMGLG